MFKFYLKNGFIFFSHRDTTKAPDLQRIRLYNEV